MNAKQLLKLLKEDNKDAYERMKNDLQEKAQRTGRDSMDVGIMEDIFANSFDINIKRETAKKVIELIENDKAGKKYIIRDREAGNFIDEFDTLEEAQKEPERYEQMDKDEGDYTPDFYEIVESEG